MRGLQSRPSALLLLFLSAACRYPVLAQDSTAQSTATVLSQQTTALSTAPSALITSTSVPPTTTSSQSSSSTSTSPEAATTTASSDNDNVRAVERYYYVFVAVAFVFVLIAVWLEHKRRSRKKRRTNSIRHTALAQDTDGWPNSRRWLHGNWRSEPIARREEGLDERGEAPPPYARDASRRQSRDLDLVPNYEQDSTHLRAPPRALTRDHSYYKPPDYEETLLSSRPSSSVASTAEATSVSRQNSTTAHHTHNSPS